MRKARTSLRTRDRIRIGEVRGGRDADYRRAPRDLRERLGDREMALEPRERPPRARLPDRVGPSCGRRTSKGSGVITRAIGGSSKDSRSRPKGANESAVMGSMARRCRGGMGAVSIVRSRNPIIPEDRSDSISIFLEIQLTDPIEAPTLRLMTIELHSAASILAELGNETRLAIVREPRAGGRGRAHGGRDPACHRGSPGRPSPITSGGSARWASSPGPGRAAARLWCTADTGLVHSLRPLPHRGVLRGRGGRTGSGTPHEAPAHRLAHRPTRRP